VMRQNLTAYASYLADYKDQTIPAAPHWDWAHGVGFYGMKAGDPFEPAAGLTGSITKIWTTHFISAVNYPLTALQFDKSTFNEFMSRPKTGNGSGLNSYGADSAATAFAFHPSFGMNGVYVGGAYTHGAFRTLGPGSQPRPNTIPQGGTFWVANASKVRWTQRLIIFAASRGGDVKEGSWWDYGAANPNSGTIRPGYWMVTAPKPSPVGRAMGSPYTLGNGWISSNKFDPNAAPSSWGMVDFRYFNKASTGMFDGHVESQKPEQLRDMTKWSNFAKTADWNFQGTTP